jgi:hypothetical protein
MLDASKQLVTSHIHVHPVFPAGKATALIFLQWFMQRCRCRRAQVATLSLPFQKAYSERHAALTVQYRYPDNRAHLHPEGTSDHLNEGGIVCRVCINLDALPTTR